jgi:hypothetical protein
MTSAARGAGSSARQREREVHVDGDGDAAAVSTQGLCDRLFSFSHFFFGKVAPLQFPTALPLLNSQPKPSHFKLAT